MRSWLFPRGPSRASPRQALHELLGRVGCLRSHSLGQLWGRVGHRVLHSPWPWQAELTGPTSPPRRLRDAWRLSQHRLCSKPRRLQQTCACRSFNAHFLPLGLLYRTVCQVVPQCLRGRLHFPCEWDQESKILEGRGRGCVKDSICQIKKRACAKAGRRAWDRLLGKKAFNMASGCLAGAEVGKT